MVQVWALGCASCTQWHSLLLSLNKSEQFKIIGLNYNDDKNNSDLWLNKFNNPYKVNIFNAKGRLYINLGVYGTPTFFIIDRAGIIRYRHVGVLTKEVWSATILPKISRLIN